MTRKILSPGDRSRRTAGGHGDNDDAVFIGELLGAQHFRGGQGTDDDLRAGGLDDGLQRARGAFGRLLGIGAGGLESNRRASRLQFGIHLRYRQVNAAFEILAKGAK